MVRRVCPGGRPKILVSVLLVNREHGYNAARAASRTIEHYLRQRVVSCWTQRADDPTHVTDYNLVLLALLLSLFGLAMVYSAGQTDAPSAVAGVYKKQFVWLLLGVAGMLLISRASVRMLDWVTIPAYALTIALLVATLVIGTGAGTALSSKSWIGIGGFRCNRRSSRRSPSC